MPNPDPLVHIRALAERDPVTWAPALAEHERQLQAGRPDQPVSDSRLPSLTTQAINFGGALIRHVAAGMPSTPEDLQAQRLATCQSCPRYQADTQRCGACGCYVRLKAAWAQETCPERHW
jgi:hypothetical protein